MDIILDTIHRLMEGLGDLLLSPLVTDSLYRHGFLAGVFTTVAIGWLGARLLAIIQRARRNRGLLSALPCARHPTRLKRLRSSTGLWYRCLAIGRHIDLSYRFRGVNHRRTVTGHPVALMPPQHFSPKCRDNPLSLLYSQGAAFTRIYTS